MAAITAAELLIKYSVSAAAGNTTAGTAAGSLGDQVSTTQAPETLNSLFDDISGAENAASDVEYRCIFLHNSNTANVFENAAVYIDSQAAGGANIAIGVDPTAASAVGSASAQAVSIPDEGTAPAGVAFSTPTSGSPLALGNIPANGVKAIWIRRTAANTAAMSNDNVVLGFTGETGSL